MVSLHCTMAKVNRLTHACVPYSLVAALLLPHTKPGMEGGKATEQSTQRGHAGEEAGQWRDENPWVIILD